MYKYISLLMLLLMCVSFVKAQCPQKISCIDVLEPPQSEPFEALQFIREDPFTPTNSPIYCEVTVSPQSEYNGTYYFNHYFGSPSSGLPLGENFIVLGTSCPDVMTNNIVIEFDNTYRCQYSGGNLKGIEHIENADPCSEWLMSCEPAIQEYVLENFDPVPCKQWDGNCQQAKPLHRVGKVAIGTNEVRGHENLAVAGGVIAEEVLIQLCGTGGWCDYVFDDTYPLMTLTELEQSIHKNGHLPKTRSAKEIEAEGNLELRATALDQQEKIEESFLYLIELKNRMASLKTTLETIEAENQQLKDNSNSVSTEKK